MGQSALEGIRTMATKISIDKIAVPADIKLVNRQRILETFMSGEKQTIAAELTNAVFVTSAGTVLKLGIASVALTGSMLLLSGRIDVLTLLVKCGLAASKGEARRLVQQGGVAVNDQKVSAIETTFGCEQFTGDGVIIKKGKKVFHRAVLV